MKPKRGGGEARREGIAAQRGRRDEVAVNNRSREKSIRLDLLISLTKAERGRLYDFLKLETE